MFDERGQPETTTTRPAVVGMALLIALAFYLVEQRWSYSTLSGFQLQADDIADELASGNFARKLAYAAIAVSGALLLLWPSRHRLNIDNVLSLLILGYFGWCFMSAIWTTDPGQTVKRLGVLSFCLLGILGICRRFGPRQLLALATIVSASYLAIGVLAEALHGSFTPWRPAYRFSGTVHPNTQGAYMAVLALASFFGLRGAPRGRRWGWLAMFLLGLTFLALTKSRGSLLGMTAALTVGAMILASARRRAATAIAAAFLLLLALTATSATGMQWSEDADVSAYFGRGEGGLSSLNGRIPLWTSLLDYSARRPWLGFGYGAFWTPARVARISAEQEWTVPSAHSAYIEVLLALGIVGLSVFVTLLAVALFQSARRYANTRRSEYGLPLALLVFGAVTGLFESGGYAPVSFDSFITACALGIVAFRRDDDTHPRRSADDEGHDDESRDDDADDDHDLEDEWSGDDGHQDAVHLDDSLGHREVSKCE